MSGLVTLILSSSLRVGGRCPYSLRVGFHPEVLILRVLKVLRPYHLRIDWGLG